MEKTSIPNIDNDPAWKTSHKLCNVTASAKNYCTSIMSGNMTKYSNARVIGSHHTGIKGTANLHQEQAPSKGEFLSGSDMFRVIKLLQNKLVYL